jgi:hypothetical protein
MYQILPPLHSCLVLTSIFFFFLFAQNAEMVFECLSLLLNTAVLTWMFSKTTVIRSMICSEKSKDTNLRRNVCYLPASSNMPCSGRGSAIYEPYLGPRSFFLSRHHFSAITQNEPHQHLSTSLFCLLLGSLKKHSPTTQDPL